MKIERKSEYYVRLHGFNWLTNWLDKKDYSKLMERRSACIRLRSGRVSFLWNGHCTSVYWTLPRHYEYLEDFVNIFFYPRIKNRDFENTCPEDLETNIRNRQWVAKQNFDQSRICMIHVATLRLSKKENFSKKFLFKQFQSIIVKKSRHINNKWYYVKNY